MVMTKIFKPQEYGWSKVDKADPPFCVLVGEATDAEGKRYYLMRGTFKDNSVRTVAQQIDDSSIMWAAPETWEELGYTND